MPAIIGPLEVVNVVGGDLVFGDSAFITPKISQKVYFGTGGDNTGGVVITNNGLSTTNVLNPNVTDQPIVANK